MSDPKRVLGTDAPGEISIRRMEADLTALRNRIKVERSRSSQQGMRMLHEMETNLLAARERSFAEKRSKMEKDEFLRKARLEVSAARTCASLPCAISQQTARTQHMFDLWQDV